MIPETLEAWTIERLRALLDQRAFENERLEWKERLPQDDGGKLRLRSTMAALANTSGGFVVFGVKDDPSLSTDARLVGISGHAEFAHDLAQLLARCQPQIDHETRNPPLGLGDSHVDHVVHVPASGRRPHGLAEDDKWRFPMRVAGGTRPMTWAELRDAFSDVRRRRQLLRLLRSEVERVGELVAASDKLAHKWRYAFREEAVRAHSSILDRSQIERVLTEIFDDLATDSDLVAGLNELRGLIAQWDAGAAEFGARVRAGRPDEDEIARRDDQVSRLSYPLRKCVEAVLAGIARVAQRV